MPDASGRTDPIAMSPPPRRRRRISPLLRRVLLLNALPPVLLAAALLYLDQYQAGLLAAEVDALRTQARITAGGIGEAAVRLEDGRPILVPELARPLLRRLVEPSPATQARLFDTTGLLVADSRLREGPGGAQIVTEPLPPPMAERGVAATLALLYDRLLALLPRDAGEIRVDWSPGAPAFDWQPDLGPDRPQELRAALEGGLRPYVRRTAEGRLLVSVTEPARSGNHILGLLLLTREARAVDARLMELRVSVLGLVALSLLLTVALSFYLARTLAAPILELAEAAARMRDGQGRAGSVPPHLLARRDEIGVLARDLQRAATALWARIDANERFAADVAHELRNPLTSVRSAIETLRRVEDPAQRNRLVAIIAEDAVRMDRLIADIADSSRVDAEISRSVTLPVDIAPILSTLAELHETTRAEDAPHLVVDLPAGPVVVRGIEGRLVQVFRNLIGNALSFSPERGTVRVIARRAGREVEIAVEDEGPGIPEAKLEHIFQRFYSERPRTERFGQHSGLGLSITRQIVEGFGGTIRAENRRDETGKVLGARFVVRLPAA